MKTIMIAFKTLSCVREYFGRMKATLESRIPSTVKGVKAVRGSVLNVPIDKGSALFRSEYLVGRNPKLLKCCLSALSFLPINICN